ncbi:MAG: hypothetical protein Q7S89_01625 [bacterium]|nr:hypothetical protein [bacterium]
MLFGKKKEAVTSGDLVSPKQPGYSDSTFSVMPAIAGAPPGTTPAEGTGIFDQPEKEGGGFIRRWWILGVIVGLVLIVGIVFAILLRPQQPAPQIPASTTPESPAIVGDVGEKKTEVSSTAPFDDGASIATLTVRSTSAEDMSRVQITVLAPEARTALTLPTGAAFVNPTFRIDVPAAFLTGDHPVEIVYERGVAATVLTGQEYTLAVANGGTTLTVMGQFKDGRATAQLTNLQQAFVAMVSIPSVTTPTLENAGPMTEVPPAPDSDQDGLTDIEEQLLGTDRLNPDTDGDTYKDGAEVLAGFNPKKGNRADLATSGLLNKYTNPLFGYGILYPSSFLARAIDETNREVLFTAVTGELITVTVDDQVQHPTLDAWYKDQFPDVADTATFTAEVGGVPARYSPDGLSLYFLKDGRLFAIGYNPAAATQMGYPTIFKRMIKDFTFKQAGT